VPEPQNSTNVFDRISILSAAILLAYTLAGFVSLPTQDLALQLPGFYLEFQINLQFVISLLVAGLSATGTDWLVRGHPQFQEKYTIHHWLLPALSAWVIGMVLFQQPFGLLWWITFIFGGGALTLVLIAEYIVVDPTDVRQFPATIGLIALSFALLLTLVITIRAVESRLFILVPTIVLASGLTSLRTLYLRLQSRWVFTPTVVIAILMGQLSAALNYLPIEPVTFGLAILGPTYALTSFFSSLMSGNKWRQAIVEPIFVLIVVGGIAFILR
jgi:hypothetical protein